MNKELYKWIIPCGQDRRLDVKTKGEIAFRYKVAGMEVEKINTPPTIETVKDYVNEFLDHIGMKPTCHIYPIVHKRRKISYCAVQKEYGTKDIKDLVWIKFTNKKYVGAVCVSNDVNFLYNNTSGRIVKYLNQEWNKEFVLLAPLCDIPDGMDRRSIESGVGNYLIAKNVPILDFYSHNL